MPAPASNSLRDALGPMPQGINSGLSPTLLAPTQLAFGVNITCRGGFPHNRPPWRKLAISYANADTAALATHAIFQGAAYYSSFGNNPSCLIASIGGRIFRYVINNNRCYVQDLTPGTDVNNPTLEQAWLAQGQDFLLINDGESRPYVFDGAVVKRLPEGTYLPASRQVHYVNGRFVVVLPDARSYIASDLVYNTASGTATYKYRDSILRTTDNEAILAGASFAVPLNAGPITALFSAAIPDTSLGQGPLQVATLGGIFSVNLPLDATLWTTTEQPTQVISLPNGGVTGQYSVATVNGDAWYRAPDGLRSFQVARRDFNTWVQTPLSFELARVLPFDTASLLGHSSAVNFNNRFLCTCSPYRVRGRGIAHRGLVSLDFNNISSLTTRSQPAYDGLWTGQPVLQLVKGRFNGVERCFAFCLACDDTITLYEIGYDDTARFDYDGSDEVPMECWLETGAILGREGDPRGTILKRLLAADLWLSNLSGTGSGNVTFNVSYVSDEYPCWQTWGSEFALCAPACAQPTNCTQPVTTHPQYATFLRLPQPADTCNPVTDRPHRTGYHFQVKLAWTGHAQLNDLITWAVATPENLDGRACTTTPTCTALQCCTDDLFSYQIEEDCDAVCDVVITVQPTVSFDDQLEWSTDEDAATFDTDASSTIISADEL
jgi:hypothetical protein